MLRSRARSGITIEERSPSERRNSRSSGECAMRRSSSSCIVGHHSGRWRHERSSRNSQSGRRGGRRRRRSSITSQSARPLTRTARRVRATVAHRVDHADVGERRDDDLGRPRQRFGQRQRAVGDAADGAEQPEALGAAGAARPYQCPARGQNRSRRDHGDPAACSELPVSGFQSGLAAAAPTAATPTIPVPTRPREQGGNERRGDIRPNQRPGLRVERDVDERRRRRA